MESYRCSRYATNHLLDQTSFYIMRATRPVGGFNSMNHDDMLSRALQYLDSHRPQLLQQFPAFGKVSNFQRIARRVSGTRLNEANRARSTTSQTPRLSQPQSDLDIQAPRRSSRKGDQGGYEVRGAYYIFAFPIIRSLVITHRGVRGQNWGLWTCLPPYRFLVRSDRSSQIRDRKLGECVSMTKESCVSSFVYWVVISSVSSSIS
jgi:hypothetical protein